MKFARLFLSLFIFVFVFKQNIFIFSTYLCTLKDIIAFISYFYNFNLILISRYCKIYNEISTYLNIWNILYNCVVYNEYFYACL